ncbi:hypothetical protein ACPA54_28745 [Uniformispora flossi]|uniref:hypothetical protein n=1 Tax=Uniformispora flossi TaxID=3390723 RepID=UPI003C2DAA66
MSFTISGSNSALASSSIGWLTSVESAGSTLANGRSRPTRSVPPSLAGPAAGAAGLPDTASSEVEQALAVASRPATAAAATAIRAAPEGADHA